MSEVNKLFEDIAYHSIGIVPIKDAKKDFNRYLSDVSPDVARKMKRKFRKLWRRCVKEANKELRWADVYAIQLGMGASLPTKMQKKRRKEEVRRKIIHHVVKPIMTTSFVKKSEDTSEKDGV